MIGPELLSFAGMHTIIKLQCDLIKGKEAFSRNTHRSVMLLLLYYYPHRPQHEPCTMIQSNLIDALSQLRVADSVEA
jgi:hypothetical protein